MPTIPPAGPPPANEPRAAPPTPTPIPAALCVGLAGAALIAVVLLALPVLDGAPFGWDRAIMLGVRVPGELSRPIGPAWLYEAVVNVTALGSGTVLTMVVAAAAGLLLARRLPLAAALVLAATTSGSILADRAKYRIGRPRPELVEHLVQVTGASFPSGHATNSAIVYLTLAGLAAQVERRAAVRSYILTLAIMLVGAIGLSRVYLGVHWPSDVLAGWCAGTGWAAMWWWIGARVRGMMRGT